MKIIRWDYLTYITHLAHLISRIQCCGTLEMFKIMSGSFFKNTQWKIRTLPGYQTPEIRKVKNLCVSCWLLVTDVPADYKVTNVSLVVTRCVLAMLSDSVTVMMTQM